MIFSSTLYTELNNECCPIRKKNRFNRSVRERPWTTTGLKNACQKKKISIEKKYRI